ncbi:LysR family transcriptional regulator [Gluconobacter sp. Dm-62]|uniref:LysR family transcriptional regulator n=1 Tax=Gluconobacter sp. Dm-62 TaxID=2799804 RepID=UPI001B8D492E|nr:LysR family transcriptional regulator [Gluconobacter sp. Dm-62]MBS1102018.1 LysR family transcriptional regulator [Gluconobacter sp. Dm-62]
MDRLTSMAVFLSVIDLGSFTAAAERHSISGPMVAKHVNALEAEFQTRLLHRTTRRLTLTEIGSVLAERYRRILADMAEAQNVARAAVIKPSGRLRISAPVTYGSLRVAPLLASYLELYPDVQAELMFDNRIVDLIEDSFDVAFRIGELKDDWLVPSRLGSYQSFLAAAPAYLAKYGCPRSIEDLQFHRLIGFPQWQSDNVWTLYGPGGEYQIPLPAARIRINHAAGLREAAVAGFGIILQSSLALESELSAGRLVRILPDYAPMPRPINLLHLPDRRMPASLRLFINFIKNNI